MEIEEIVREKSFWVATTIGSIVLTIIGNLLTPVVRSVGSRLSRRLAAGISERRKAENGFVERLVGDEGELLRSKMDLVTQLLWSVLIQLMALMCILRIPFGILFGGVLTLANLVFIGESLRLQRLIRDAEKRKP